jgi:nucleotide-binding universal stress UspA family protein
MKEQSDCRYRLLLPIDSISSFDRVAPLAGQLLRMIGLQSDRVQLLHVVAGSFLHAHMGTIDLAAGEVPTPESMRRLRLRYLENTVRPLLNAGSAALQHAAGGCEPEMIIKDGDPVKVISSLCRAGDYSTLIMTRCSSSGQHDKLMGSVTAGILHRQLESTIYLVGDRLPPEGVSPFCRCLIGVDDSQASRNSVAEAGMLLARVDEQIERVYLVHVLDQSCYYDEDGVSCIQASLTGQKALEESGALLVDAGVKPEKITPVIHFGKPGTVLVEEAIECDATMIFIGRRDRSRQAQVFLGSVCTDIIQNCREKTLVLSS